MATRTSKATTAANMRLVELIRAAFDASPMNRQELADASGVPAGTIAKILAGLAPVYADQLVGIADALGADLPAWVREVRTARDSA
jgi:transcriptional regulator with XRE-family HTH domain